MIKEKEIEVILHERLERDLQRFCFEVEVEDVYVNVMTVGSFIKSVIDRFVEEQPHRKEYTYEISYDENYLIRVYIRHIETGSICGVDIDFMQLKNWRESVKKGERRRVNAQVCKYVFVD